MKKYTYHLAFFVFLTSLTACTPNNINQTNTNSEFSVTGIAEHSITVGSAVTIDPELHPMMLGVISGPEPTGNGTGPTLTTQYQDIGITSVRNNDYYDDRLDLEGIFNCGGTTYPSWEGCDANDDSNYNWTKSDKQYQSYIDGGFIPFLRIGGEWSNQSPNHDFKGPQNTTQEDNWIIAANKMVDRYQNWSGKPNAFTYLDIWTEYPGTHFWDRKDPDFVKFWVKAYKSLKASHPKLKIGGPGFGAGISMKIVKGEGGVAEDLLREMYNQGLHLDWLGWHTFGSDPTVYSKEAKAYQDLLDGTGEFSKMPWAGKDFFTDTEVFTDAYGNGSADIKRGAEFIPVNTARGAAVLTAGWISLQYADIQGAYYYRGNDQGSPGEEKGKDGSGIPGLFTSAGDYKPSANAFRLWSKLTETYSSLLETNIPVDGTSNDIWALAATNSTGGIGILVANTTETDSTISINWNGKEINEFANATIYEVDDTHDGKTATKLTTSTVSIPAGAIELIELQ